MILLFGGGGELTAHGVLMAETEANGALANDKFVVKDDGERFADS